MITRRVTKTMVKDIVRDIKYLFGVHLDGFQVCYILLNHQDVRDDWDEFGDVDTEFRIKFLNAIIEECKMTIFWPIARNTKLVKRAFEKEFRIKAKKYGYKLTDDFDLAKG